MHYKTWKFKTCVAYGARDLVVLVSLRCPGGTGDFTAMFDDLRVRYPDNRFIGVGFSLGACILVRFLGEDAERHRHFVCAASICQGYDPFL